MKEVVSMSYKKWGEKCSWFPKYMVDGKRISHVGKTGTFITSRYSIGKSETWSILLSRSFSTPCATLVVVQQCVVITLALSCLIDGRERDPKMSLVLPQANLKYDENILQG